MLHPGTCTTIRPKAYVSKSSFTRNVHQVAKFLHVNPETGLFYFDASYRPVPLTQQYIGVSEQKYAARNTLMNEICYNKVSMSVIFSFTLSHAIRSIVLTAFENFLIFKTLTNSLFASDIGCNQK
jgi:hypothetical protein